MTAKIVSRGWLGAVALIVLLPTLAMNFDADGPSRRFATRTVWDSVYTASQAVVGEAAYGKTCARCHGASLSGGDESPPLTGSAFLANWNGLPLSDLQTRVRTTMPTDSVGIYDRQLVTNVIAYLLKSNGFPAGQVDLPSDIEPLKEIVIRSSKP